MENRITALLSQKKQKVLSIFFTAGYPALDDTLEIAALLEQSGADMIEIGIPFSDPIADGAVIQHSSNTAIQNGMSLELLFRQLTKLRERVRVPVILMGYLNPVYQFGITRFIKACAATGIDGVILPDLPPELYEAQYKAAFQQHHLSCIFLVTPETPQARLKYIDRISNGFIYLISASSTTGAYATFKPRQYKTILECKLRNPLLIGFGISNKQSFEQACESASGAIIGSAFVKSIAGGDIQRQVPSFISSILN